MNFDVVDIKLLRDHSTELAQFGPTPLDLGIAPNMEVTDDQMVAAHLHVPQELKHAIGRDDIKEEAWVLRNVSVQNEFDVIGLHTRSLRKLLIESMSGAGERQRLTDLRIGGMLATSQSCHLGPVYVNRPGEGGQTQHHIL
ncbi:hypothetical protein [Mesorhizobium sp.]|uniref:hypothetical protein n=1 Tax=Mesorhizobium sp. TaxID=1871066 RepID=UPI0025C5D5A1|nr:hypothetical protein [Mesorhizobium sp.]